MINGRILFNKMILFTSEMYLQKAIDAGFTAEPLHKQIVDGVHSYLMVGKFSGEEAKMVLEMGDDEYLKNLKEIQISWVVYALELLRLWVTEIPHQDRKAIYLGVGNKKLKLGPGVFVMSMLNLKKEDKEKYEELSALIKESKITAKKFFMYTKNQIEERTK